MKLTHDYHEFKERVDIQFFFDLAREGIYPDSFTGVFEKHRLSELLEFCRKNPVYHVISMVSGSGAYFNKPTEAGGLYFLGIGDNDPEIAYSPKLNWEKFCLLKSLKFDADKI
jgi:hypothetical protein